jgi:hypothetical protein
MDGRDVIHAIESATAAIMLYGEQQRGERRPRSLEYEDYERSVRDLINASYHVLLPGGAKCPCCDGTGTAGTVQRRN